jgi:tetratricopeptide (TPR) repeat protein
LLEVVDFQQWRPSLYRKTAAYLAAQAYLLRGLIELHRLQLQQRIGSCQKAVEYATAADHPALLVKALTLLGNASYDQRRATDMLHTYQHARYLLNQSQLPLPEVLHSKVLMGLAHAYAQQGKATEALNALHEAHAVCPDETEEVPVFLAADDGLFSLILFDGWVRLDLGKHEAKRQHALDAAKALACIDALPPTLFVPERIRLEITNRRAQAALTIGDLDAYCHYTRQHAEEMKALSSEKRRQERRLIYQMALKRWPQETKIAALAQVLF